MSSEEIAKLKGLVMHLNNGDYERMTETEILTALADERLDIECKEEEPLINNWIAKNPKNNERMMRLKSESLKRRGTDGRLAAVVRDRVPREIEVGAQVVRQTLWRLFNPRAHTWVVPEAAVREIPRAYHGAVLCAEKMIIFGGFNGREYFQHAKIFDLNKKSWEAITNMHDRRCYVAATPFVDPIGTYHVVAIGGYNGHRRLNSAEILHIEKNHWYHLPFMAKQRSDAGAVVLAGRPTVIGGFDGRTIHNDIEMLDFETQT
ncbi:kelch repeat protein, partial [Ostertagia ostertagi]